MIDSRCRKFVQKPIDLFTQKLAKTQITPNVVSVFALVLGVLAAIAYAYALPIIVSVGLLWVSGFLDVVDGTLARMTSKQGKFGTVLDIVFDRIVEGSIIIALVIRNESLSFLMLCLFFSILITMTVFLSVGATAENTSEKTFKYQAGLAERTEGFIMFTSIMIFTNIQAELTIVFIAMIVITIMQRFIEAYKILN